MGTCMLIQRLENKGEIHRRSSADLEDGVARWLEKKSGSGMETVLHTRVCGAFRGEKQFEGNR